MGDLKQFHAVLVDLVQCFDELLVLERKKLEAVTTNNVDLLEQYMKDEQAFTLKLKGLEFKREKIQAQCGFEGLTLKTVIERVSGEDKSRISEAHQLLEERTQEMKNIISTTNKCIEQHLHTLEQLLARASGQAADIGYDNRGAVKKNDQGKTEFKSQKV